MSTCLGEVESRMLASAAVLSCRWRCLRPRREEPVIELKLCGFLSADRPA